MQHCIQLLSFSWSGSGYERHQSCFELPGAPQWRVSSTGYENLRSQQGTGSYRSSHVDAISCSGPIVVLGCAWSLAGTSRTSSNHGSFTKDRRIPLRYFVASWSQCFALVWCLCGLNTGSGARGAQWVFRRGWCHFQVTDLQACPMQLERSLWYRISFGAAEPLEASWFSKTSNRRRGLGFLHLSCHVLFVWPEAMMQSLAIWTLLLKLWGPKGTEVPLTSTPPTICTMASWTCEQVKLHAYYTGI